MLTKLPSDMSSVHRRLTTSASVSLFVSPSVASLRRNGNGLYRKLGVLIIRLSKLKLNRSQVHRTRLRYDGHLSHSHADACASHTPFAMRYRPISILAQLANTNAGLGMGVRAVHGSNREMVS